VRTTRDAADRGALIRTRTRAVSAVRQDGQWRLTVEDGAAGAQETIAARALVNAAGPWVEQVAAAGPGLGGTRGVRLVQGSHIVVRKLFDHDRAYIFQNPDGRVVFAIPYEGSFTLIGTTDRDYAGDPAKVAATSDEVSYLCAAASACFAKPVSPSDVVWTYAGVRPLQDDGARDAKAASRDYVLAMDEKPDAAPALSVIGGKITIYRRLAEAVLERLAAHLPGRKGMQAGWTGTTPLPGGEFEPDDLPQMITRLSRSHTFLAAGHAERLVRAYGTQAGLVLGKAKSAADLGRNFGATLSEAEVRYLVEREWASTADDVVWRRSKLGLRLSTAEVAALDDWMRGLNG
jgi:glycerol-3-phosphate dehydrogenase